MANEFVARNGIIGLKDSQITGSLYVSSSVVAPRFTGSLFGTASWADNANTASFVTGSSVRGPYGQNSVISSSYAVTASYALNAGDVFPYSGSAVITGSLLITNLSGSGTRLVGATSDGLLVDYSGSIVSGAIGYIHSQSSAATTWNVTHGLNVESPLVTIYNSSKIVVIPNSITITGPNTLDVGFTTPLAGYASIVDPTSQYEAVVFQSALVYKHTQSTLSTTWNINHNLKSTAPIVTVYDGTSKVMIPQEISVVDQDNLTITFSSPESGSASIIGNLVYLSGSVTLSSSYALSASYAVSASYSISSSYSVSSSAAIFSISSSYPVSVSGSSIYSRGPLAGSGFNTSDSIYFGNSAGYLSQYSNDAIFLGNSAGYQATNGYYSNFLGLQAGYQATNAYFSNFFGREAGSGATGANNSNFFGQYAGIVATNAYDSNFFGNSAGGDTVDTYDSNFFGNSAGYKAKFANDSNFLGYQAGYFAASSSYSNLFGYRAGVSNTGTKVIGRNNIIIGTGITLEPDRKDSINLGGIIFATGSHFNLSTYVFSGSVGNGRVGINVVNPVYNFDVSGSGNYTNGLTVTGSLIARTITGSLQGTSSWATNSITASYALTASYLNPIETSYVVLTQVSRSLNYVDDTAAAAGGVPLGGLYRNGNFILIRIT